MTIYVEYAIIDNLVINSFLLLLVNKFMKFNSPKWKIFLSSFIGTIFSLITPILPNLCNIFIKILLLILMPLIICKNANFKKMALSSLLFLFLTFVFIGLIIVFCYTFNIDFSYGENGETFYNFPVGLALLLSSFLFIVLKQLIKYFYQKKHLSNFTYSVTLFSGSCSYSTLGFLDTGNLLFDKDLNKPITMINLNTFTKLYPDINLTNVLLKKNLPLKNYKYLNVYSIGKSQSILVFEIQKLEIKENENTIYIDNPLLGLSLKDYSKNLDNECILNYKLFENGV